MAKLEQLRYNSEERLQGVSLRGKRISFGKRKFMRVKKTVLAIFMALMMMSGTCLAENMQFVDANGSTGYYVDVSSIAFEGDQVVNAKVAMIKAVSKRMYVYQMRFDRGKGTYQTLWSEIRAYDKDWKDVLSTDRQPQVPRPYGTVSPMHEMVEFIYEYTKKK